MSRLFLLLAAVCSAFYASEAFPSVLEEDFISLSPQQTTTVQVFALKAALREGDNEKLEALLTKLDVTADEGLTKQQTVEYLVDGGLNKEQAILAIESFLPALDAASIDEETQLLALLTIANLVCKEDYEGECNVAEALSFVTPAPYYGCKDTCFCNNQKDIYLWSRFVANDKLGTAEFEQKYHCSGMTKDLDACECQSIEEMATDKRAPTTRNDAIMTLMLQNMAAEGASPQVLSIMANMGSSLSSAEAMRQMMVAQMGLDPTMTHLLLHGGRFSDDDAENKILMLKFLAKQGGISVEMLPLLAGDADAKEFLIYNMIASGSIDPFVGFMMLASGDTVNGDVLQTILMAGLTGGADLGGILADAVAPYVPELPEGIYPGSELGFAHFEALGVSTCALHDLRNRFECGYLGISATECEIAPYCCYSPVFMSDAQVASSTDGVILAASSVPWCFYNVFFVFPTEFHLTVQGIGGFPAAHQCPPLFKFGLELDPTMTALIGGSSSLTNAREDCGFPGITEFHCIAIRGCCFDPNAPILTPQCYKAIEDAPSILNAPVPDMFIGVAGQCDVNLYKIPFLYYHRVPCHYGDEHHAVGFDILQEPTKEDCLTRLGCCWESDDEVAAAYPTTARCYAKAAGGHASPLPSDMGDLIARMGETTHPRADAIPRDDLDWE